jgi:hypothetical protein
VVVVGGEPTPLDGDDIHDWVDVGFVHCGMVVWWYCWGW